MKDWAPEGDADAQARLESARAVYASIFRALQTSLARLESAEDTPGDARHRQELYRAHLKQLQHVFEIEGALDTYGSKGAPGALDLDAARSEIRERLARIREHGGR